MVLQVFPPIPLISSAAEHMYYGLHFHPSYIATHRMLDHLMSLAELPALQFHEVDGAPSNVRLNAYLLSLPEWKADTGGKFLDHARCQNHATHLITVCMLSLVGSNILSKMYQLSAFLGNLGYVLRLQMAVTEWLQENLEIQSVVSMEDARPCYFMEELHNYLRYWQHHNKAKSNRKTSQHKTKFEKQFEAFRDMWNGSAYGKPVHFCNCNVAASGNKHCLSRDDAVKKMASSLVGLLVTSSPSPPTPNKWTKLWKPLDFVGIGVACLRKLLLSHSRVLESGDCLECFGRIIVPLTIDEIFIII